MILVQGIEINFDNFQGLFRSQTLDGRATAASSSSPSTSQKSQ